MALEQKQVHDLAFMIVVAGLTCIFCLYHREIAKWIVGNLRGGGPRPPSHPLPGDDGLFLLRRRPRNT